MSGLTFSSVLPTLALPLGRADGQRLAQDSDLSARPPPRCPLQQPVPLRASVSRQAQGCSRLPLCLEPSAGSRCSVAAGLQEGGSFPASPELAFSPPPRQLRLQGADVCGARPVAVGCSRWHTGALPPEPAKNRLTGATNDSKNNFPG